MKLYTKEDIEAIGQWAKQWDLYELDKENNYKPPMFKEFIESLTPIELPSDDEIIKVKATRDESGHWYVIPNELIDSFHKDEQNENMIDSGEFDNKWGGYMTGGGLNLIQLYAKKEQILNQNK